MPSAISQSYSAKQRAIHRNVVNRGYADGYTDEQFLLRQTFKLLEEAIELFQAMPWLERPGAWSLLMHHVGCVQELTRQLFDDPTQWKPAPVSDELCVGVIKSEAVDVVIVLACLTTALELVASSGQEPIHLLNEAIRKSANDIKRGVR